MTLKPEFYSGYLLRFIQDQLEAGHEESGLYNYYATRVPKRAGLIAYEIAVAEYVAKTFVASKRRIVHVGIGLGTVTTYLSILGYHTIGVELDRRRAKTALRLRTAVSGVWPEVAERYIFVEGMFPDALQDLDIMAKDALLLFTNAAFSWPEGTKERMFALFPTFGDVILDLRQFGKTRELETERADFLQEVMQLGANLVAEIPSPGVYYRHFQFV